MIKLFEEYNNYYQELTVDEFYNIVFDEYLDPNEEIMEFNQKEINNINSYITKKIIHISPGYSHGKNNDRYIVKLSTKSRALLSDQIRSEEYRGITNAGKNEIVELSIIIKHPNDDTFDYDSINIYKLPDEWYMVSIYGYGHFKCDQIEGFYKFIDDYTKFFYKKPNKYIKEQYYQELTTNDFNRTLIDKYINLDCNEIDFEESEINSIKSYIYNCFQNKKEYYTRFTKNFGTYFVNDKDRKLNELNFSIKVKSTTDDIDITIYKIIDEWYIIKLELYTPFIQKSITDMKTTEFYKCDQIEGLYKCIDYIKERN